MYEQLSTGIRAERQIDQAPRSAHPLIFRIRFQLLGGLLVAVVIPSAIRYGVGVDIFDPPSAGNTLIGAAMALLLGYVINREIVAYPGVRGAAYILPTFAATYLGMMTVFFLFRFDYARLDFLVSFGLCVAWFYAAHFVVSRWRRFRLAVVPCGQIDELREINSVDWVTLVEPVQPGGQWDGVVADLRADLDEKWVRFIADCALASLPVFTVKQVRESLTGRVEIEHLSESTLGSLIPNHAYIGIKGAIDRLAAVALLPLLLPLFLVIGVLIHLDSPGPVLFRQVRRGYLGRPFTVYKFRTMVHDADRRLAPRDQAMTNDNDARVTRVGGFLRRIRLDELPQVINILRGEMSWIGPRPEALSLAAWYEAELPFYSYRAIVKPGISGWAQVNQGHVADVELVRSKLHLDFYYIKHFSPWLDILIALRTVKAVATGEGAR